jgi:hypothetical protein
MLSTTRARLPTPRTGPRTACVRCLLPGYARRTAWPGNDADRRASRSTPAGVALDERSPRRARGLHAYLGRRHQPTRRCPGCSVLRRRASALQTTETFEGGRCMRPLCAGGRPDPEILRPLAEPPANVRIIDLGQDHRSGPNAQPHARRRVDVVDSARPGLQTPYGTKDGLACAVSSQGQPAGPHPRGEVMRTGGHPSRY